LEIKVFENNEGRRLRGITAPLLKWYDENARVLPWRENTEPYRVWVSEIMLQQTQVETVIPYYRRFMAQLPDIGSLADAGEAQLLKLWEGLGYYSRARNLQKAAGIIMDRYDGRFPDTYADICALPGIGSYTAGAIASICFGLPAPAVDGNVLRVIARLTGSSADIARPEVKKQTAELLGGLYPEARCGDFTQSLMELGAVICLPRGPKCGACPLTALCRAYETGTQAGLPIKTKNPPRKKEQKTIFILRFDHRIAIRQRDKAALLGGLWEFPNASGALTADAAAGVLAQWGVSVESLSEGPRNKHVFTHIEWEMKSYIVRCGNMAEAFVWVTKDQLTEELAIPAAFRAFLGAL
jgi:A/G-specific adenine glycosylase